MEELRNDEVIEEVKEEETMEVEVKKPWYKSKGVKIAAGVAAGVVAVAAGAFGITKFGKGSKSADGGPLDSDVTTTEF